MDVLPFNSQRSVYLPEIDAEHLQIYCTLEEVRGAIGAAAPAATILGLMQRMAGEIVRHFAHEERLMRASGYPEYPWHKRQHATARRRVEELIEGFSPEDCESAPAMLDGLHEWLSYHVSVADSMASSHIRNYERQSGGAKKSGSSRKAARLQ